MFMKMYLIISILSLSTREAYMEMMFQLMKRPYAQEALPQSELK
jgi:hypothetical protein